MTNMRLNRLLAEYFSTHSGKISLDDFFDSIESPPADRMASMELARSVLIRSGYLTSDGEVFVPRNEWFKGRKLLIQLTDEEASTAVLIPGHRFMPYLDPHVNPSRCRLILPGGRDVSTRVQNRTMSSLEIYYSLYDSNRRTTILMEESQTNIDIMMDGPLEEDSELEQTVFELASIAGKDVLADPIVATAVDPENGVFQLEELPPPEGGNPDGKSEYVTAMDRALAEVDRDISFPLNADHQLALAMYRMPRKFQMDPVLHIGGYLKASSKYSLSRHHGITVLSPKSRPKRQIQSEKRMPLGSLERMLEGLDMAMSEPEIEAIIRDELFRGGVELEGLKERMAVGRDLHFSDDTPEAEFDRLLEELMHEVQSDYNIFSDRPRGPLRQAALDLSEDILTYIRSLDVQYEEDLVQIEEPLAQISELAMYLSDLIISLNSSIPFTPEEHAGIEEFNRQLSFMAETFEDMAVNLDSIIAALEDGYDIDEEEDAPGDFHAEGIGLEGDDISRIILPKELLKSRTVGMIRLRISLDDTEPEIWRELDVPDVLTLWELHLIIQTAMGWTNSHLHNFTVNGVDYSDDYDGPDFDISSPGEDEAFLKELGLKSGDSFHYFYDFGDNWKHRVTVLDYRDGKLTGPWLIGGERACPPEDCGGSPGFAELLRIIESPRDTEHPRYREIYAGFDPKAADLEEKNKALEAMLTYK